MLEYNRFIREKMTLLKRCALLLLPFVCVVFLLSQTVFAKNTYLINDSGRILIHTTYASDPAEVLTEAGLKLGADDTFTTAPGLGVSEITVQRKMSITVYHGGQNMEIVSYGETVEQLLDRLGIELSEGDIVSLPLNQQVSDGLVLTVTHASNSLESYTVELPYETKYCYDVNLPLGEEKVLTQGVNGEVLCTAEVVYRNGQEISRHILTRDVTKQPVDALIVIGTGAKQTQAEAQGVESNGSKPVISGGTITLPTGEVLTYTGSMKVKASAYTSTDAGCNDYTATGTLARVGAIAVDPSVIPYGTRMYIVSDDGKFIYGIATAEDTGGSIKGNRIDLFYDTELECLIFGRRNCTVYFLG